jgi:hypothetical protein
MRRFLISAQFAMPKKTTAKKEKTPKHEKKTEYGHMKGGRVQFIIGAAGFRLVIAPLFLRMEFGYRLGPGFFFFFFLL